MKFTASLALIAAPVAMAAVLTKDVTARTIGAVPLKWTGPVNIGSANITLIGTAESIYKQILALNPNYDHELGIKSPASLQARALEKRDPINSGSINCNVPWDDCDSNTILDGINYLYGIGNGICNAPPGSPGHGGCTRVSCSYNSGIWLCNDQPFEADIPCRIIADNAAGIRNQCSVFDPGPIEGRLFVRGQIFSFNNAWDVIVHSDRC